MFFFFFDDFNQELKEFIVDPGLKERQRECVAQHEEFQSRFPLERVSRLDAVDFYDPHGGKEDFCYWITSGTNAVTTRLPWAKQKVVFPAFRSRRDEKVEDRDITSMLRLLRDFINSHGKKFVKEVERCFGQPLLLKLLHLYYPDEFCNIVNVGWVDRIVAARALDYGHTVYERSHAISTFRRELSLRIRSLDSTYFASFLIEYLDLPNKCGPYVEYLINHDGFAESTAERCARSLRQFSRLLTGYGIRKKSLFDVNLGTADFNVLDCLERLASVVDLSPEKKESFRRAYEFYTECSKECDCQAFRCSYTIPAKRGIGVVKKESGRKETDDKQKKASEWKVEFGKAPDADGVADILRRSGLARPYYRHYTSFSAFLSISDGLQFRLTRGDNPAMNDQLEWKRLGDSELWKRTFIASFSCVKGESAAMWGLYGKPPNEALRLSFKQKTMTDWILRLQGNQICPKAQLFSTNDMPGDMVELNWDDVEVQFGDVLYGGDVGGASDGDVGYVFRGKVLGKTLFSKFDPKLDKSAAMTGFVKSADWAYEDEARLIVRLKEEAVMPKGKSISDVQYIYVPIPKDALMEVEYMKGPCLPVTLGPIVEEKIRDVLSPRALVCKSKYTGNLKFK